MAQQRPVPRHRRRRFDPYTKDAALQNLMGTPAGAQQGRGLASAPEAQAEALPEGKAMGDAEGGRPQAGGPAGEGRTDVQKKVKSPPPPPPPLTPLEKIAKIALPVGLGLAGVPFGLGGLGAGIGYAAAGQIAPEKEVDPGTQAMQGIASGATADASAAFGGSVFGRSAEAAGKGFAGAQAPHGRAEGGSPMPPPPTEGLPRFGETGYERPPDFSSPPPSSGDVGMDRALQYQSPQQGPLDFERGGGIYGGGTMLNIPERTPMPTSEEYFKYQPYQNIAQRSVQSSAGMHPWSTDYTGPPPQSQGMTPEMMRSGWDPSLQQGMSPEQLERYHWEQDRLRKIRGY